MIFGICCRLMGFCGGLYNGVERGVFEEEIEGEYLGGVLGVVGRMMWFGMGVGLVVWGGFGEEMGVKGWFLL